MALTDVRIRQARPTEKAYRLTDSGGLFLEVRPNGNKFWRYAYRIDKKQNLFAVGTYPAVTLQQAREEHTKARALVKSGLHPARERSRTKLSVIKVNRETFKAIAEEWFESKRTLPAKGQGKAREGWSEEYEGRVRRYLDNDVYPKIATLPIRSIQTADVANVIGAVEKRGAPTAAKVVRQIVSQVFYYAIEDGLAEFDPTYVMRRRGTRKRAKVVHKTPLRPDGIGSLLKRTKDVQSPRPRVIAIQLLLLLFVRGRELRMTTWAEILPALETSLWEIPEHRMKMRRIHLVPLPAQAIALLKELHALTGDGTYLFPHRSDREKPMGSCGVNYVLRKMGYGPFTLSGHGFRATASTLLNELGFMAQHVDMQLAHSDEDAYNQARYLPERTEMMRAWANLLDRLERGEKIDHYFVARNVPAQLAA